jgi:diaminobutyrate acetyltransferase (EC 2.3.1.178)
MPVVGDAPRIYELVKACPPLDLNSRYHYLLLADHFAATSVVAELSGKIIGYVSAYVHPHKSDTLFVWQVAVGAEVRRHRVGHAMLEAILLRDGMEAVTCIETT